jgi:CheY-like chemotaxis protein
VRLTVSDTGIGIAPENVDRIFDPYFTTKRTGKGTGMGLSVVHGIVQNHRGAIFVESTPGAGTTFHIFFPVTKKKVALEPALHEPIPAGKECILLVDDEPSIVDMGRRLLEKMGYRIIGKTDPFEALTSFREDPARFDLVVLDMTMPKMTGDLLAEKMLAVRPDLPVIVCTGFSEKIDAQKAKTMGIRELMMKPVSFNEIAQTIRKVLDG